MEGEITPGEVEGFVGLTGNAAVPSAYVPGPSKPERL